MVYVVRPTTREDMIEGIRNAVASISLEEISRSGDNFRDRMELYIAQLWNAVC